MADDDPSCGTAGPERKKKSGSAAEPAQKVHPDCRTSAYPHIFPFLPVIRGSATLCYRCKTNKPSAVFRDQSWCNECHQNSVNLRFRLGLRTIQHQQAGNMGMGILVAYSGGTCSTALLDLVNEYMVPDGMRPRKFTKLVVCHVDETAVLPLDEFNLLPDEIRMSMDNVVKSYPAAKFVRVPLEAVFEDDEVEKELLGLERLSLGSDLKLDSNPTTTANNNNTSEPQTPLAKLHSWFAPLSSKLSSKEDLLHHFRTALLRRIAKQEDCQLVVFGDNMTRLAVKTLSMTIKGKGEHLPLEIAGDALLDPHLQVARPLKELLPDELVHFNRIRTLTEVPLPDLTSGLPFKASIDRLTETLVVGLQKEFPATVGAVAKTAGKVTTTTTIGRIGPFTKKENPRPEEGWKEGVICAVCQGDVGEGDYMWRRERTVESLKEIGQIKAYVEQEQAGQKSTFTDPPFNSDTDDICVHLCYGCQNIARDLASSSSSGVKWAGSLSSELELLKRWPMPGYSLEAIARNREKMREEIKGFLLGEEGDD